MTANVIARGHSVSFELADGRKIYGPRGSEILHDETGRDIPKDIAVVMRFEHTGKPLENPAKHVRQHFGDYPVKDGRAALPTLRLSSWTEVGPVKWAYYTRRGELHHGQKSLRKEHEFSERGLFSGGSKLPTLYKRGDALLLKLTSGQHWDWRGVSG